MPLSEDPFETRQQRLDFEAELAAQQEALAAQQGGTVTGVATQSAHPWRAVLRTVVAQLPALLTFLALLPLIAPQLVAWASEHPDVVPPELAAALVGFAAIVAAVSGGITKVLAIPQVEAWLRVHASWLAAAPRIEH